MATWAACLRKLDELGIADNTIVLYSTDNGPHFNQWPDAAITPYRGEKEHQLGRRLPGAGHGALARQHQSRRHQQPGDVTPGLGADAHGRRGRGPDQKRAETRQARWCKDTFRVHLDGYNFLPFLTGEQARSHRGREFFYFSDDGVLTSARVGDWKFVFAEQRARRFDVWRDPFRAPAYSQGVSTCAAIRSSVPTPIPTATTSWWDKKDRGRGHAGHGRRHPVRRQPAAISAPAAPGLLSP